MCFRSQFLSFNVDFEACDLVVYAFFDSKFLAGIAYNQLVRPGAPVIMGAALPSLQGARLGLLTDYMDSSAPYRAVTWRRACWVSGSTPTQSPA